jgi:uncharacterized protein (DUF697 family)
MKPSPTQAQPSAEKADWQVVDDAADPHRPGRAGNKSAQATAAPGGDLQTIAQRCRRRVTQRALVAAGVAVVPIPGLDWAADVGLLMRLLPQINAEFGLSPEQIERLAPDRRVVVFKAISAGGGLLVGKLITRELVLHMVKLVGLRLTAQQAAKFVPLAGQAVSALLTFSAMRFVCEQHIRQCMDVARQVQVLDAR